MLSSIISLSLMQKYSSAYYFTLKISNCQRPITSILFTYKLSPYHKIPTKNADPLHGQHFIIHFRYFGMLSAYNCY